MHSTRGLVVFLGFVSGTLCIPDNIDAVLTEPKTGKSSFFLRDQYWEWDDANDKAIDGYPRKIADGWYDMPNDIDAILTEPPLGQYRGFSYFFKGDQYWKWDHANNMSVIGYPKKIIDGWFGIPNHIDAILTHGRYSYFFKRDQYWKWDDTTDEAIDGYPRKIVDGWYFMPKDIDAILTEPSVGQYYGYSYFFKGGQYWKWDHANNMAVSGYPRMIARGWFSPSSSQTSTQVHASSMGIVAVIGVLIVLVVLGCVFRKRIRRGLIRSATDMQFRETPAAETPSTPSPVAESESAPLCAKKGDVFNRASLES